MVANAAALGFVVIVVIAVLVRGDQGTGHGGLATSATVEPTEVAVEAPHSSTTAADSYQVTRQGAQDVLDGVWRLEIDRQRILDTGASVAVADANAGIWTMTIKDHIASVHPPRGPDCTFDFAFNGGAVSIDMSARGNGACYGHAIGTFKRDGEIVTFSFEREKDGSVALDNAEFARGMQKIG